MKNTPVKKYCPKIKRNDLPRRTCAGVNRWGMWELGTIEGVGTITCSREPFLHRASAHDEQKIYLWDDDIISDKNIHNPNEIHLSK